MKWKERGENRVPKKKERSILKSYGFVCKVRSWINTNVFYAHICDNQSNVFFGKHLQITCNNCWDGVSKTFLLLWFWKGLVRQARNSYYFFHYIWFSDSKKNQEHISKFISFFLRSRLCQDDSINIYSWFLGYLINTQNNVQFYFVFYDIVEIWIGNWDVCKLYCTSGYSAKYTRWSV
jgi:hypothetical protein